VPSDTTVEPLKNDKPWNPIPQQWSDTKKRCLQCVECGIRSTCKQVVFGRGNLEAEVMIIGEAPGYNEDKRGSPFVGKAGQELYGSLLTRFARIREDQCYVTNIVKCRPPNNRDPRQDEVVSCKPWLKDEFRLISGAHRLRIVVVAGSVAGRGLYGNDLSIERCHGFTKQPPTEYGDMRAGTKTSGESIQWILTYHPAYGLHDSKVMTMIQQDFINVGKVYRGEEVNPINKYPKPKYRMLENGMVV